jgi:hypothetical protein
MSGSSAGLPLRPGNDTRVKSESDMDELMDGHTEDTPEASVESARSDGEEEETEESRKLRKKREVCSIALRCCMVIMLTQSF